MAQTRAWLLCFASVAQFQGTLALVYIRLDVTCPVSVDRMLVYHEALSRQLLYTAILLSTAYNRIPQAITSFLSHSGPTVGFYDDASCEQHVQCCVMGRFFCSRGCPCASNTWENILRHNAASKRPSKDGIRSWGPSMKCNVVALWPYHFPLDFSMEFRLMGFNGFFYTLRDLQCFKWILSDRSMSMMCYTTV